MRSNTTSASRREPGPRLWLVLTASFGVAGCAAAATAISPAPEPEVLVHERSELPGPDAWDALAGVADRLGEDVGLLTVGLAFARAGRIDLAKTIAIPLSACRPPMGFYAKEHYQSCANKVMLLAAVGDCGAAFVEASSWSYGYDVRGYRPSTLLQAAAGEVLQRCHDGDRRASADELADQILAEMFGGRPLSFAVPALEDGYLALGRVEDAARLAEIGGRARAVDLLLTSAATAQANDDSDAAERWRAAALTLAEAPLERVHFPVEELLRVILVLHRHEERELTPALVERAWALAPDFRFEVMLRLAAAEPPKLVLASWNAGTSVEFTLASAELVWLAGGTSEDCATVVSVLLGRSSFDDRFDRPPLRTTDRLPRPLAGLELVVERAIASERAIAAGTRDPIDFARFVAREGRPDSALELLDTLIEIDRESDTTKRAVAAILIEAGAFDRVVSLVESADPSVWPLAWTVEVLVPLTVAVMSREDARLEAELIRLLDGFAR